MNNRIYIHGFVYHTMDSPAHSDIGCYWVAELCQGKHRWFSEFPHVPFQPNLCLLLRPTVWRHECVLEPRNISFSGAAQAWYAHCHYWEHVPQTCVIGSQVLLLDLRMVKVTVVKGCPRYMEWISMDTSPLASQRAMSAIED